MNHPFYEFSADSEHFKFRFESVGERIIIKAIHFQSIGDSFYNLALGDLDELGNIDVLSVSNNGDMEKVLATTIQVIFQFFIMNPSAIIYFHGSTPVRTRLYRIAISRELDLLSENFSIYGVENEGFEVFQIDKDYRGFVTKPKEW